MLKQFLSEGPAVYSVTPRYSTLNAPALELLVVTFAHKKLYLKFCPVFARHSLFEISSKICPFRF